ncbi:DEAD/DEAH box helicase [Flavobacteriales bacterium]|jgi:ATP-dependent RNA helicase RhlE|nr:DEAD/DEAH box helicase [Flavobacteriales bacterium]
MPFSSLGLSKELLSRLLDKKYEKPYPIQQQAIPAILKGKDLLGIAQTGSGKTDSFVLPILNNLKVQEEKTRSVDCLVLVPTRELAVQVEEVFKFYNYSLPTPFKISSVFGGVSINPQMKGLFGVNILIATPGRLLELIRAKALQLSKVNTLVIDEADKMLNLGFKEEMDELIKLLPKKRQNLLFSATLNDDVKSINQLVLSKPIIINIKAKDQNLDLINQTAYFIQNENKGPFLRQIIEDKGINQVLIFTSSTFKADNVAKKLVKHGIKATAIHSKKSQGSRTDSLVKFKNGTITALVATDLLARGIDIEFLPFVINYELPRSPKDFIHRIGRTGRAENPGEAITFVSQAEEHHFKVIQKKMGKLVETLDGDKLMF